MKKVVLYIALSEDGFIADTSGNVDWLPNPTVEDLEEEDFGYNALMTRIDTILMGSNSYNQILGFGEWSWPDKQTYVFTAQPLEYSKTYIQFTTDSPKTFMNQFRDSTSDKDIWLLGGAKLAQSFAKDSLIDEVILTIVPISLGRGIPLGLSPDKFTMIHQETFKNGMIQRVFLKK